MPKPVWNLFAREIFEEQWHFFEVLHCEVIQGFHHAVPMSAEDIRRYLEKHRSAADPSARGRS
jgi:hypothetical protein